eukprot:3128179-Pyramimonas_sp.AAC.1
MAIPRMYLWGNSANPTRRVRSAHLGDPGGRRGGGAAPGAAKGETDLSHIEQTGTAQRSPTSDWGGDECGGE